MAKKKKKPRQPYTPPTQWDHGQQTAAQNHLKVIEDAGEVDPKTGRRVNPNGVTRARRLSVIEDYFLAGKVTARQMEAGKAVLLAWEGTECGPSGKMKERVDRTAKPDENITVQLERMDRWFWISNRINLNRHHVMHVCRLDREITKIAGYCKSDDRDMQALRDGLDALADAMERRGR